MSRLVGERARAHVVTFFSLLHHFGACQYLDTIAGNGAGLDLICNAFNRAVLSEHQVHKSKKITQNTSRLNQASSTRLAGQPSANCDLAGLLTVGFG